MTTTEINWIGPAVITGHNTYPISFNKDSYLVVVNLEEYRRDVTNAALDMVYGGYIPDILVPIGRGGFLPSIFLKRALNRIEITHKKIRPCIVPIVTNSYDEHGIRKDDTDIYLAQEALEVIRGERSDIKHGYKKKCTKVLFVDDVDDKLRTARDVHDLFQSTLGNEYELRRLVPYSKPQKAEVEAPDPFPPIPFESMELGTNGSTIILHPWIIFPTENSETYQELYKWAEDFKDLYRNPKAITLTFEEVVKAYRNLEKLV